MIDQRAKFTPRNLSTEFIGEAQTDPTAERKVLKGEIQLVLISPESIINVARYRNMLLSQVYKDKLVGLVIDEAHCVKTWGDKFRTAFAHIGELRSLLPSGVSVMALTATATTMTYHVVCERLSMVNPVLIAMPPYRLNIMYRVLPMLRLEDLSTEICEELATKRLLYPKTIIFVRSYTDCSDLYLTIEKKLGKNVFEPQESPALSQFRMVDMYTRVSTARKKECIIAQFSKVNSVLRVVIATTSFGMGIDSPNIRKIIHWGVPENLEQYAQETGRAGRDGEPAEAILYSGKVGKHPNKKMRAYLVNDNVCRRKFIFEEFLCYSEQDMSIKDNQCCDLCIENS